MQHKNDKTFSFSANDLPIKDPAFPVVVLILDMGSIFGYTH